MAAMQKHSPKHVAHAKLTCPPSPSRQSPPSFPHVMATSEPTTLPRQADFDAPTESFNAAAWVNASLPTADIPTLLESLSAQIDAAHHTFDTSLNAALTAIPWVVRETERIRQRANLLRTNVDGVGLRVAGVEAGVVSSVKTIADADTVVRRVQTTVDLLQTALRVENLLERLDALLASTGADGADLVAAADVIAQLRTAFAPLSAIPELAGNRARLNDADASLQNLAAPQLRSALEARNAAAARNARIVFDHAGRGDAFRDQYGQLRAAQLRAAWTRAWKTDSKHEPASSGPPGDLAGPGSVDALNLFYKDVAELVDAEGTWVRDAFPDLADSLLPVLVRQSVASLSPRPIVNVYGDDNVGDRLFEVAICSVRAAANICRALLPSGFNSKNPIDPVSDEGPSKNDDELMQSIADSISALLMPFRKYWDTTDQVAMRQTRKRAGEIALVATAPESGPLRKQPPLGDIAKDVDTVTKEAIATVEDVMGTLNTRTCGVGVRAMKQAAATTASVLTDRLSRVLRLPKSTDGDEWARMSGSLRLLIATSALKRAWDTRRESSFAVAVGTATPVLEVASLMQENMSNRIAQFFEQVESGNEQEAGVVWELVRDKGLAQRVVSDFESLESANDFQSLIDLVHRIVYDTMFSGVERRFQSFSGRELWSGDGEQGDSAMLGFTSSPLGYATEVADYLMTIPQQLEPFVPDEDDARYATPRSPYAFSKTPPAKRSSTVGNSQEDENEEDDDENMAQLSFAGIWISALTIGTMELYVEKICSLTRLSESGTRQLATDADYICNVVASLGVAPTSEMTLVCKLLECPSDAQAFAEAAHGHDSAGHRKLVRRVAAVRAINVTI